MVVRAAGCRYKMFLHTPAGSTTKKSGGVMADSSLKSEFLSTMMIVLCMHNR